MTAKTVIKEEDRFQAVLLAENFTNCFEPFTRDYPLTLLPLVNTPLVDYTLNWLERSKVDETIVYCQAQPFSEVIREHCKKWCRHDRSMKVTVIASENCFSLGDAMRDLYSKLYLKSDFVLLSADSIGNFDLKGLYDKHKKVRENNKSVIMTNIYLIKPESEKMSKNGKTSYPSSSVTVVADNESRKIVQYNRHGKRLKVFIPKEILDVYSDLKLFPDLRDPHVSICSEIVPSLFADNFDYGTRDSFIQGVIEQEDLLGYSIRADVLKEGYSMRISSYKSYQKASLDIMKRYSYPLVPERGSSSHKIRYNFCPFDILYSDPSATFHKKSIKKNVVLDAATNIHAEASIENSVIGKHCEIGKGAIVKNSFIMDNVKIEEGCILNDNFINNGVTLLSNVKLEPGVVLGAKVILGPNITVPRSSRLVYKDGESPDTSVCGVSGRAFHCTIEGEEFGDELEVWGKEDREGSEDAFESDDSKSMEGSEEFLPEESEFLSEDEGEQEFLKELKESLTSAFKVESARDRIVLEINSARLACNIPMEDLISFLIKGILTVSDDCTGEVASGKELWVSVKKCLDIFKPVLSNYVRKQKDQLILLKSIEELVHEDSRFLAIVQNVLHQLNQEFDMLDDEIIIYWYDEYKEHGEAFPAISKHIFKFVEWLKDDDSDEESD